MMTQTVTSLLLSRAQQSTGLRFSIPYGSAQQYGSAYRRPVIISSEAFSVLYCTQVAHVRSSEGVRVVLLTYSTVHMRLKMRRSWWQTDIAFSDSRCWSSSTYCTCLCGLLYVSLNPCNTLQYYTVMKYTILYSRVLLFTVQYCASQENVRKHFLFLLQKVPYFLLLHFRKRKKMVRRTLKLDSINIDNEDEEKK